MTPRRACAVIAGLAIGLGPVAGAGAGEAETAGPQTVHFTSADGRTELVGYLVEPAGAREAPRPAVVLLHGRAGLYSSTVNAGCTTVARGAVSACGGGTLSARHRQWAAYWAARGYAALLVDSFGPRGRAHGFGRGTHGQPEREPVNERTVRPLDAEGALAWLAARPDVDAGRVMLMGWSNGGSTVLNTLHRQAEAGAAKAPRFRAALAFYPGCGAAALLARTLKIDVPLQLLLAGDDDEVSPALCRDWAARASPAIGVQWYDGATHGFDDPGRARQALPANRRALADALERAGAFFDAAR